MCGQCGKGMGGRNIPFRGKEGEGRPGYRRYVCSVYLVHGKAVCHYNAVDEAPLVAAKFCPAFFEDFRSQAP